jgi:hypothetical protein
MINPFKQWIKNQPEYDLWDLKKIEISFTNSSVHLSCSKEYAW